MPSVRASVTAILEGPVDHEDASGDAAHVLEAAHERASSHTRARAHELLPLREVLLEPSATSASMAVQSLVEPLDGLEVVIMPPTSGIALRRAGALGPSFTISRACAWADEEDCPLFGACART